MTGLALALAVATLPVVALTVARLGILHTQLDIERARTDSLVELVKCHTDALRAHQTSLEAAEEVIRCFDKSGQVHLKVMAEVVNRIHALERPALEAEMMEGSRAS